jgi:Fur family transcriptional regulator, ferric uptake regulator
VDSPTALRFTKQRRIILEELRRSKSHPTADEVYDMVRRRLPNISLGTVYRNLVLLSELGLILRLDLYGTRMHFDGTTENHYHVRCVHCGRVEDVPVNPRGLIEEITGQLTNYTVISHKLEFVGLCPRCKEREADPVEMEATECAAGA